MSFSYDLTTAVGKTRFHLADTNASTAIWTDEELLYCLSLAGQQPELAAARALRAAAADAAKLAVLTNIGTLGNDERHVYKALLEMAAALESQAAVGGSISSPDQVFSTASGGGATQGSMDTW